ncbi:Plasmodium exported protein (PHISTa-like), unknown, putative [Plasmodium gaboni]|uniref:Uncharacterized protein n=1 Tax=Plasmodium gaboni TaxID=647221 RepID=A0ABY0KWF8_9APIC|nr:Plasmodium exported protein (PHISTa-like), unknown, putative [Plasmodium gaboni]
MRVPKIFKIITRFTLQNKLYNDMSKKLTKKELFDILNSLDECPPKNDLINILYHTLLEDTSICTETHFAFYRTVSKEIIE